MFNFGIDETTPIDWDGSDFNPEILVTMKLAGNYQPGFIITGPQGDPAKFEMSMGEMSKIEIPIDDASFTDEFQDGGDIDGGGSEDTPGFSLVVASAAIAMAVFVNARREEE